MMLTTRQNNNFKTKHNQKEILNELRKVISQSKINIDDLTLAEKVKLIILHSVPFGQIDKVGNNW